MLGGLMVGVKDTFFVLELPIHEGIGTLRLGIRLSDYIEGFIMGQKFFSTFAKLMAKRSGSPTAFSLAALTILVWIVTGPVFKFSDTWQLVINTGTTIITFLMVFIIQNTQNRDTEAIQLKLDELLRISSGHNALMDIEELSEDELDRIKGAYEILAKQARKDLRKGRPDTDAAELDELQITGSEVENTSKSRKTRKTRATGKRRTASA
jgi:low affinity Fe/Cu permease